MLNPAPTVSRRAPGAAASRRGELQKGGLGGEGIWLTDVGGRLKPEVEEVCKLVAEHGAILSTAHISPAEIVALVTLARLHASWANQREAILRASEARADQAEARPTTAEAVVTAQAQVHAATATALAYANSPEAAVDRSLNLVLAAERDPTDQRLQVADIQLATLSRTDCSSG